ncbi:unnamed protein product [Haemonchus placei]|uniref:Uncharacterized protein n=1 Tax=Haemonchus placei TaxID=6290 RepID=A0A3P7XW81_HAEPC|nr:unnamed protein product [Haemonchus placei]
MEQWKRWEKPLPTFTVECRSVKYDDIQFNKLPLIPRVSSLQISLQ